MKEIRTSSEYSVFFPIALSSQLFEPFSVLEVQLSQLLRFDTTVIKSCAIYHFHRRMDTLLVDPGVLPLSSLGPSIKEYQTWPPSSWWRCVESQPLRKISLSLIRSGYFTNPETWFVQWFFHYMCEGQSPVALRKASPAQHVACRIVK